MTEEHCRRCPLMNSITGPTLTREMPQTTKCISMRAWTQTTSSPTNTQGRWISLSSSTITVRVTKLNNRLMSKGRVELLFNQSPRTFTPGNRARRSWAVPMLTLFWARATRPSSEAPHQDSRATPKSRNREYPTLAESAPFTSKFPRAANFLVDMADQKRYFNIPIPFRPRTVTHLCIRHHWVLEHRTSRMVSALFPTLPWTVRRSRTSNLRCSPTETAKTSIKALENQALSKTSPHSRSFLIPHTNLLPREPTKRVFSWTITLRTWAASRGSHLSESRAHPSTSRKSNRLWSAPSLQKRSLQLCIHKRISSRTFWTQISPWTCITSPRTRGIWLTPSPSNSCILPATCREKLPPISKGKTLIANTTWLKILTDTWGNLKKPTMSPAAWTDTRSPQLWEPEWSTGWLRS